MSAEVLQLSEPCPVCMGKGEFIERWALLPDGTTTERFVTACGLCNGRKSLYTLQAYEAQRRRTERIHGKAARLPASAKTTPGEGVGMGATRPKSETGVINSQKSSQAKASGPRLSYPQGYPQGEEP